jgi:stage II sporulation protein D
MGRYFSNMRKLLFGLIILLLTPCIQGQKNIRVQLFAQKKINQLQFQSEQVCMFKSDTTTVAISAKELCTVTKTDSCMNWKAGGKSGSCTKFILLQPEGKVSLGVNGAKLSGYIHWGSFELIADKNSMYLVNILNLDTYVAGVVEAEGGANKPNEYYKVQAVLCRTYALNNFDRHPHSDLCDGTHCQVYHGLNRKDPRIEEAVKQTEKLVVIDENAHLITAFFHSNCGGHTLNSEMVWKASLPYCKGKPDPYCMGMPNSNWEKRIPIQDWTKYLETKKVNTADTLGITSFFPGKKVMYYQHNNIKIPTKTIRTDLKLKSAYFTVHLQNNEAVFIGQGFGHGVGLCQEGAMNMAKKGKTFEEILNFYYTNVHLVPYDMVWLFTHEEEEEN